MSTPNIRVTLLQDAGDVRGSSFSTGPACISFLSDLRDLHITTLLPGYVRGNHYHRLKREVLLVLFKDRWELDWDSGENTSATRRQFEGSGVVLVEVEPEASHSVTNSGLEPLWIVGLSSTLYDPGCPDAFQRRVRPEAEMPEPRSKSL